MSTIEHVFDALRDTVLDLLGGAGVAGNSKLIAFEPGTPIPDQSFRLGDEARTLSPELAREFMSTHADTFPEVIDSLFSRRMLTVENQYGLLLSGATPIDPATTELLGAVKRVASDDFDVEVQALQPGIGGYRPVIATPANWYDLSADGNWTTISIGAADDPPPPQRPPGRYSSTLTMWQTLPSTERQILSKPLDIELFDATATPFVLGGTAPLERIQPVQSHIQPERAIDARFLRQVEAVETPFTRVRSLSARQATVRRDAIRVTADREPPRVPNQRISENRLFTAKRLGALNELVRTHATPKPVSTDSFNISFRLCLVQLHRPWLSQSLLSLPGWYLPGFTRGSLSDASSQTAPMSLVPTGCILIRDLSIKGQWTDDDREALSSSASLGPLSLLGRDYDAGSASITVSGMQSIGWLCERMPIIRPPATPISQPYEDQTMDAAIAWPNSKHYLFSGSTYQRWDALTGVREAADVPISSAWGTLWPDGVDAGVYWGYNKAFFFKGSEYCRYDCATDTVDYIRPIVDFWPGLWPSGIEACINWTNGKLYIFRGSEYVRWDIGFDRMDDGYPRAIAGAWNGIWADGVDAALYPGGNEVYFFKGQVFRIFDIAADASDGVDRPMTSFAPAGVPRGLLTPARDLSRDDAAKIAVWQANKGLYQFKTAWTALTLAADGSIASLNPNKPATVEPRRIGMVEYVSDLNHQSQTIDNLDPRMLVTLERLGRWMNADHPTVSEIRHLGIGHGGANPNDCHNQGRALDLSGLTGSVDDAAFDLQVKRDWGAQPEGQMGLYRLDATTAPTAHNLFKRAYAFGTYECECNHSNVWPPTEIGEGGFVICPDHWGDGSADNQRLRLAHNNHIHMQIGPTVAH